MNPAEIRVKLRLGKIRGVNQGLVGRLETHTAMDIGTIIISVSTFFLGIIIPSVIVPLPQEFVSIIGIIAIIALPIGIFLKIAKDRATDEPKRAHMVTEHMMPGLRWRADYQEFYVDLKIRNGGNATGIVTNVVTCAFEANNDTRLPTEPIYNTLHQNDTYIQYQSSEFPRRLEPGGSFDQTVQFDSITGRDLDDAVDEDRKCLIIYGYIEYTYTVNDEERRRRTGFIKAYLATGHRHDLIDNLGLPTPVNQMNNLNNWAFESVKKYYRDVRI